MLKTSRTVTADVLVIGGGGAACTAAVAAARAGSSVVLVSKGKAGNSGNTIMIGGSYGMDGESAYYDYHIPGADPSFTKEELFRSIVNDGFNLSDQNLVEQFVNDSPRIVYEVKEWGEEIGERFSFYAPSNWDVTGRSMGRALMNGVKKMANLSSHIWASKSRRKRMHAMACVRFLRRRSPAGLLSFLSFYVRIGNATL